MWVENLGAWVDGRKYFNIWHNTKKVENTEKLWESV